MHTLQEGLVFWNGKISNYQIHWTSIFHYSSWSYSRCKRCTHYYHWPSQQIQVVQGVVNVKNHEIVTLIPVQKAQIAKYALASGNKAAILLRYTKEFQTEINYKMSSVSTQKAKYASELNRYLKSSSGNGSRDVASAVLQNNTSHTALTKNIMSHMLPNPHQMPAPSHS